MLKKRVASYRAGGRWPSAKGLPALQHVGPWGAEVVHSQLTFTNSPLPVSIVAASTSISPIVRGVLIGSEGTKFVSKMLAQIPFRARVERRFETYNQTVWHCAEHRYGLRMEHLVHTNNRSRRLRVNFENVIVCEIRQWSALIIQCETVLHHDLGEYVDWLEWQFENLISFPQVLT